MGEGILLARVSTTYPSEMSGNLVSQWKDLDCETKVTFVAKFTPRELMVLSPLGFRA